VSLPRTPTRMSVWKSNFFLQTGLPESLPKPLLPDPVAVEQDAASPSGKGAPRKRASGERGKDKVVRKKRAPSLYNFYETMRGIELREADGNQALLPHQTQSEYRAFSQYQRTYWEYLQELYAVFEKRERVADRSLDRDAQSTYKKKLRHRFYFLTAPEQQQLVRDYLADRWEKENYDHVRETCHQDNLRQLVDIRRDLRSLLAKVERALKPRAPDADGRELQPADERELKPALELKEAQ